VAANLAWGKTAALANIVHYGTEPAGQMWLRALIMVVIPLVFSRLSLGVAGLGDLRKLGRVGLKTMLFFLMVTTLAAVLGLTLVNLVRPGAGLPRSPRSFGGNLPLRSQAPRMQRPVENLAFRRWST